MCYMPTGSPEIRSYLRMYQSENVEHPTLAGPRGWTNEVKVRDYRKILYFIVWRMIKWSQWRSSPNHKTVSLTFGQNWYNHGNRDTLEKGKKELRQDCQSSGNIKNCWFFQMTIWKKMKTHPVIYYSSPSGISRAIWSQMCYKNIQTHISKWFQSLWSAACR